MSSSDYKDSDDDDDFFVDSSEESLMDVDDSFSSPSPVKAKSRKPVKKPVNRQKTIPISKKPTKTSTKKKKDGKPALEDIYKKLSQLDHVLQRPDTYVGSIEQKTEKLWIYDEKVERMVYRNVTYVPGLFKIFDEILVNAADNYQRDKTMKMIKVTINQEKNEITIWNDGEGIPIEIHSEEKMLIPELIFGELLTSSHYNDEEKKVTGGRNGYGAKLANIFSSRFEVETVDSKRGKKFRMTWSDNMQSKTKPSVTSVKKKTDHTKISFTPELKRFGVSRFDDDHMALFQKRVFDIAGSNSSLKVYFNGKVIPMKSFQQYTKLYFAPEILPPITTVFEKCGERWEVCVARGSGDGFQQVSFVNSINTMQGGSHVDHVVQKITNFLKQAINKKNRAALVKPAQIKSNMFIFINCLIENPAFASQTKELLTSQVKNFGSRCNLSQTFLKNVHKKCGIAEAVLEWAKLKQQQVMKRKGGRKTSRLRGIAKLDDANHAGGRNAHQCTLILTEGDSAKTLAVSGFEVVGRNTFGVFPLRGKLLNVRDANHKQIMGNAEISALQKILGVQAGRKYSSAKELRYGHLMIMTDQDHDGSHIKGLIINFLHHYWPELLQIRGFLSEFITPIVKATKGKGKTKREHNFFTLNDYEEWKERHEGEAGWKIKYYKGLGTNTPQEAKQYFKQLKTHKIGFKWKDESDGAAIDMAFNKKKANDRKTWLTQFEPSVTIPEGSKTLTYGDFVNKELIHFSVADCARSIPSLVDGLKPGQRKILYACFKRNLTADMKVAQLAGYVAEHSAYHHGESSLMSTIVAMAQSHVGSNNINLLYPAGSFGSRRLGGKDSASPRYIYTMLSSITRSIFRKEDDPLLNYLDDDGFLVEPEYYMPVVPLILINGTAGIGTGWSTLVPQYNIHDIIDNIRRMLDGEDPKDMHPWYRGFDGTIDWDTNAKSSLRYNVRGKYKLSGNLLEITELPIGKWTEQYKEILEDLTGPSDKGKKSRDYTVVEHYTEHHTDTTVHFKIHLTTKGLKDIGTTDESIEKYMKLMTYLNVGNMHLFDKMGRIKKYNYIVDIFKEYFDLRLEFYQKRKKFQCDSLEVKLGKLDNKVRFILAVTGLSDEDININNRPKQDIIDQLEEMGFDRLPKGEKNQNTTSGGSKQKKWQAIRELKGKKEVKVVPTTYDYLLKMPVISLTKEKVDKLHIQRNSIAQELKQLRLRTPKQLWKTDLDELIVALEKFEDEMEDVTNAGRSSTGRGRDTRSTGINGGYRPSKKSTATTTTTTTTTISSSSNNNTLIIDSEEESSEVNESTKTTKRATITKKKPTTTKLIPSKRTATRRTTTVAKKSTTTTKKPVTTTNKRSLFSGKKTGGQRTLDTFTSFKKPQASKRRKDKEDEIEQLTKNVAKRKAPSTLDLSSDWEDSEESSPLPKAKTKRKRIVVESSESDEDKYEISSSEEEEEEEEEEKEKEEKEEKEEEEEEEEEIHPKRGGRQPPRRAATRSTRAASQKKKPFYKYSSEDESEYNETDSSFQSSFIMDDSDSSFME